MVWWGVLREVDVIRVWILISIGFDFFILVKIVRLVILFDCLLRKSLEGFLIFLRFLFFIWKRLILFVVLKWFFIVCRIWYWLLCFFLKYSIVLIMCFNICGFVSWLFLVIWFIIRSVEFDCLVNLISFCVDVCIWEIVLGVVEIMFDYMVWIELMIMRVWFVVFLDKEVRMFWRFVLYVNLRFVFFRFICFVCSWIWLIDFLLEMYVMVSFCFVKCV